MPALRQPVKGRRFWILLLVAVIVLIAPIADWTRPPQKQISVLLFEKTVVAPYRWIVRPFSSRFVRCRYAPTCSAYVETAIRRHGLPRGMWFSVKRLFRCWPSVKMGTWDPVPPIDAAHRSHA